MGSTSGTIVNGASVASKGGTVAPPSESLRLLWGIVAAPEGVGEVAPTERLCPVPTTPVQSQARLRVGAASPPVPESSPVPPSGVGLLALSEQAAPKMITQTFRAEARGIARMRAPCYTIRADGKALAATRSGPAVFGLRRPGRRAEPPVPSPRPRLQAGHDRRLHPRRRRLGRPRRRRGPLPHQHRHRPVHEP